MKSKKIVIINLDEFWQSFESEEREEMKPKLKELTIDELDRLYKSGETLTISDSSNVTLACFEVTSCTKVIGFASILYLP